MLAFKQEKTLKTEFANAEKKKPRLKNKLRRTTESTDSVQVLRQKKKTATNALEDRMYSVKALDDLKEQESRLKQLNEEDQAIIEDEDAASLDKEGAQERIEARNEEQPRIEEREVALPLWEQINEIFKKMASL